MLTRNDGVSNNLAVRVVSNPDPDLCHSSFHFFSAVNRMISPSINMMMDNTPFKFVDLDEQKGLLSNIMGSDRRILDTKRKDFLPWEFQSKKPFE